MKILNIWEQPAQSGDPLPNGKICYNNTTRLDRHRYAEKRVIERERRAKIRAERPIRLFDIHKQWLSIGCENPKCKYHRNGFLALEDAKKTYPQIVELSECEQYDYIIRLFEWNHIDRSKKTECISNIIREYYRVNDPLASKRLRDILDNELKNCEQLCVTCHRLETHLHGHHTPRVSKYNTYEELMYQKYGQESYFCEQKLQQWIKLNDKQMGKYDERQDLMSIFNVSDCTD